MLNRYSAALLSLAALLAIPTTASASPVILGSFDFGPGAGYHAEHGGAPPTEMRLFFISFGPGPSYSQDLDLFREMTFDLGDVGQTFWADAGTDDDFNGFVSQLTDDTNQIFGGFIEGIPCCGTGGQVDDYTTFGDLFDGATVTRLGLLILSMTLENAAVSPFDSNFDLINVAAEFRFLVEGEAFQQQLPGPAPVPEPATIGLLGAGLAAVVVRYRRKSQR
jgi:hypothetical protein